MKDLSKVDMKDLAREWEARLNPPVVPEKEPDTVSKTVLLPKPKRNVSTLK